MKRFLSPLQCDCPDDYYDQFEDEGCDDRSHHDIDIDHGDANEDNPDDDFIMTELELKGHL